MNSSRWVRRVAAGAMVTAAIAFSPAAGSASADPVTSALATTTCSYNQINAAMTAEAPDLISLLNSHPKMQTKLQDFLAMSIDQRQEAIAQQQATNPQIDQMIARAIGPQGAQEMLQVADTCQNY